MIKSSLSVNWQKGLSTVYFIFYEEYLYIGITQDLPFCRWNGHFRGRASFVSAIKKFIPEFNYREQELALISFTFVHGEINSTKELQAIEKMLHTNIDCNPFINSKGYMTVSSTKCTAPRKYDYSLLTKKVKIIRSELEKLAKNI